MPVTREQFDQLIESGLTPEQIASFDARSIAEGQSAPPRIAQGLASVTQPISEAMSSIPSGAGMLGGLAPGPIGYALAPLMAGGAEMWRQGVMGGKPSWGGVGQEAAKAEGAQLIGGGLDKFVLSPVAHAFMRGAVRPTAALLQDFPTVVSDMVKAGVGVTKGGIKKAGRQREAAALNSEGMRVAAEAGGMRHVADDLLPTIDEIVPQGTAKLGEGRAQVQKLINKFRQDYRGPLTPTIVKKIKQSATDEASPILAAKSRKEFVPPGSQVEADFWEAVRRKADDALSTIKGHKAAELTTQKAIGVEKAAQAGHLKDMTGAPRFMAGAIGRGAGAAVGGAIGYRKGGLPGAAAGAATGAAVTGPGNLSRMSLVMSNPVLRQLVSQLPPHLAAMLFMPPDTTNTRPQP